MSNTEILDNTQWSDRPLNEAQQKNRDAAALIPFTEGGMSPQNFAQVVDFAKHMAQAKGMLGPHFMGNYAGCLAIIELAEQFRMKPFMLARQTYFVNGMIAFDGQAVMSVMNLHMPLAKDADGNKTRLKYEFSGDKAVFEPIEIDETDRNDQLTGKKVWVSRLVKPSTRVVRVTGRMEKEATELEYISPPVFQIKNKKSPLWEEDEDQQLIYWSSRRWQRRHWPEGMLGIIDREEALLMHVGADNAKLIETDKPGAGMLERIKAARAQTSDADRIVEGFTKDHTHNETNGYHGEVRVNGSVVVGVDAAKHGSDMAVEYAVQKQDDGTVKVVDPETVKPKRSKKAKESPETIAERKATAADDPPATHSDATAGVITGAVVEPKSDEPEHEVLPRNAQQWEAWCRAWIAALPAAELDKRWAEERRLRNECGVTQEIRDPLYEVLLAKRDA
jgi:RecT family protein